MKINLPDRKRNRLENFDYSRKGSFFITICTFENKYLFGGIEGGELKYSPPGSLVKAWWYKIPEKFKGVSLGEYIVMPNHVHGIIMLDGKWKSMRSEADEVLKREASKGLRREASKGLPYGSWPSRENGGGAKAAPSIPQIIHWYKTWTTNEYFRYMRAEFPGRGYLKLWHRSYYDHIIRGPEDYGRIAEYIRNNPANWAKDRFSWPENNGQPPRRGRP